MIDLDATQPIVLQPTVPDIPLTVQKRTPLRRRNLRLFRAAAAWPVLLLLLAPVVITPLHIVITVLAIGMAALMLVTGIILLVLAVVP